MGWSPECLLLSGGAWMTDTAEQIHKMLQRGLYGHVIQRTTHVCPKHSATIRRISISFPSMSSTRENWTRALRRF